MDLGGLFGGAGSILQVVIGVGLLIFIHEAGHFLAARWAGVRVLAFSLGFGPEMFGFTRGGTRYRVAWFPIGGYVKMSGEVERPGGGYAPDDYPAQSVAKRVVIIGAGVAMNAVLGFVLFAAALLWGMNADPGNLFVAPGRPAWEAGLRSGDRVISLDGRRVCHFEDFVYSALPGRPVEFEVERDGRRSVVVVTPLVPAGGRRPMFGVGPRWDGRLEVAAGSPAEAAGLRTSDEVVAIEGVPGSVSDLGDEVYLVAVVPPEGPLRLTVRREGAGVEVEIPSAETAPSFGLAALRTTVGTVRPGGPAAAAGWRAGDRPVAVGGDDVPGSISFRRSAFRAPPGSVVRVEREGATIPLPLPDDAADRILLLQDLHFPDAPSPTAVEVLEGSPAEAAGIPTGARLAAVAGAKVARWEDAQARLRGAKGEEVEIEWDGPAGGGRARVRPASRAVHRLGADVRTPAVVRADSLGEALALGFRRCILTTRNIGATISGLFGGSVEKDSVGGPVLIAQVAYGSAREGLGRFLWLLAILSINLMVLNILPIPLLDGGQLALLAVEGVTRRPPSEAVVGAAQMAGLVVLLGLLLFVTFNDIARLVGG